jgi:hypothetical protein
VLAQIHCADLRQVSQSITQVLECNALTMVPVKLPMPPESPQS